MRHPCLVPYNQLSEEDKEWDRVTSQETLKSAMLLGYGMQIEPGGRREECAAVADLEKMLWPEGLVTGAADGAEQHDLFNTYEPRVLPASDIELDADLIQLAEKLAENVHESWAASKLKAGWKYAQAKFIRNSAEQKLNPILVPYHRLEEVDKHKNRVTALATLRTMRFFGYFFDRPDAEEKDGGGLDLSKLMGDEGMKRKKREQQVFATYKQTLLDDYVRSAARLNTDHETVEEILAQGGLPEQVDHFGHTALYFAVKRGHQEIVQLLLKRDMGRNPRPTLERPALLEIPDKNGLTPLAIAAFIGNAEMVNVLIEGDAERDEGSGMTTSWAAKIDAQDLHMRTPIHHAADQGHSEVVRILGERMLSMGPAGEKLLDLHCTTKGRGGGGGRGSGSKLSNGVSMLKHAARRVSQKGGVKFVAGGAGAGAVTDEGGGEVSGAEGAEGAEDLPIKHVKSGIDLHQNHAKLLGEEQVAAIAEVERKRSMKELQAPPGTGGKSHGKDRAKSAMGATQQLSRAHGVMGVFMNTMGKTDHRGKGMSPLAFAVKGDQVEVARALVELGADPTLVDGTGRSPYDRVLYRNLQLDRTLASVEARNASGVSASSGGGIGSSTMDFLCCRRSRRGGANTEGAGKGKGGGHASAEGGRMGDEKKKGDEKKAGNAVSTVTDTEKKRRMVLTDLRKTHAKSEEILAVLHEAPAVQKMRTLHAWKVFLKGLLMSLVTAAVLFCFSPVAWDYMISNELNLNMAVTGSKQFASYAAIASPDDWFKWHNGFLENGLVQNERSGLATFMKENLVAGAIRVQRFNGTAHECKKGLLAGENLVVPPQETGGGATRPRRTVCRGGRAGRTPW